LSIIGAEGSATICCAPIPPRRESEQVNLTQAEHVDENHRVLAHASEGAEQLTLGLRAFVSNLKGGAFSDLKKLKFRHRLMKIKFLLSLAKRDKAAVLETCHSIIHHQQVISRQQVAYGGQVLAASPGKGANERH
jgi:hypothetical protein